MRLQTGRIPTDIEVPESWLSVEIGSPYGELETGDDEAFQAFLQDGGSTNVLDTWQIVSL